MNRTLKGLLVVMVSCLAGYIIGRCSQTNRFRIAQYKNGEGIVRYDAFSGKTWVRVKDSYWTLIQEPVND